MGILDKMKRKLMVSIGLGAVVFLILSAYADFDDLVRAFHAFDAIYVLPTLLLSLVNYGLRFVRWQFYLNKLSISLKAGESLMVFLAGFILSITPGKAGELIKSYFIKERLGVPISQSAPAVFCERLTDLIALIFLGLIGVSTFHDGLATLVVGGVFLLLIVIILGSPTAMAWVFQWLEMLPKVGRFVQALKLAFGGIQTLIAPIALCWGVGIGILAWFAECFGFYLILKGFGADLSAISTAFIYSFSTLFGAVTMLPGGLGTTEASMTGLLNLQGISRSDAVGATIIIRLCTLWFAVAIGAFVLLRYRRYFDWEMEPAPLQGVLERDPS